MKIKPIEESDEFRSFSKFEQNKDTLNFWYKNNSKDSIQFKVSTISYTDTVVVKLRNKEIDSLELQSNVRGTLHLRDEFKLLSNIPIQSIDDTKITLIDKDSAKIDQNFSILESKMGLRLSFPKTFDQRYTLEILPNAIIDFFGNANDTLNYRMNTKRPADYGSLSLTLQNIKRYPILVQLINDNGDLLEEVYADKEQKYTFLNLVPAKYLIRIIYDDNKNKKWDTGSYLLKTQPEDVFYMDTELDVRANWEMTETLILK